jgi:hypothetical protein
MPSKAKEYELLSILQNIMGGDQLITHPLGILQEALL